MNAVIGPGESLLHIGISIIDLPTGRIPPLQVKRGVKEPSKLKIVGSDLAGHETGEQTGEHSEPFGSEEPRKEAQPAPRV